MKHKIKPLDDYLKKEFNLIKFFNPYFLILVDLF
jgi:hypothetical protein